EATAEAWTTTLHAVLSDRDRARRVGAAAHEWIKQNRRASRHVAEVLAAYESITSAAPIPFPSGEGAAGGAG
ncbi:MAG: hypothetical protein VYC34_03760, partial [Planctomycetota bacterium]|nr:hypothetical protein [Planctomycetota bacterium]